MDDRWPWFSPVRRATFFCASSKSNTTTRRPAKSFAFSGATATEPIFSPSASACRPSLEKAVLFDFVGEGNGFDRSLLEGVLLDGDPVHFFRAQATESRQFAMLVKAFTGTPLI